MTTQNLPAVSTTSLLPVEVERKEIRETRKPWVAMGLLLIAASAERAAAHLSGAEAELALGTAAAAFCTAVVLGHRSRHRLMSKHLRRRFIAAVWGAAGWLTYVAACGVTWGAAATLSAVGSLLSLLFWREHRLYARPVAAVRHHLSDDLYVKRWEENLAANGKPFAGSKLTGAEMIRSGYRYALELVPGAHTVEKAVAATATLRSGLRLMPGQEVIVEVHPELPAPAALLTIVTKSTISVDQRWPGVDGSWDQGRGGVVMGPFADGEGNAVFSIYRKDGMFGGFIQGGIGSGKSRGIETIAMACASSTSHPTTVWFACGQDGASSPLLMERADATATTPQGFLEMLDAAIQVGRLNGVQNRKEGKRGFHPEPSRPGLLIIVDEFHNFLDEKVIGRIALEIQDRMVKIVREYRKAGVALLLATQDPLLGAFGHPAKADVLRSNLLVGNGVMMRSETNNAKQVFKVDVNARDFPDLPGYGYLARPFQGDRCAPFRFYYVDDTAIGRWAGSFRWRTLSEQQANMAAMYAGRWYEDRHKLAEARFREDEELLAAIQSGVFERFERPREDSFQPTVVSLLPSGADGIPPVEDVVKFFDRSPATMHEPTAEERAVPRSQVAVLEAVSRGVGQPKDIAQETGYSMAAVHAALAELKRRELVDNPRQGRYVPAA